MKRIPLMIAVALIGLPLAAEAKPFPAGKCTTLDDGTDQARGWYDSAPEPITMEVPKQVPNTGGALDNALVVDVAFSVQADGAVSSPRALCSNAADPAYVQALLQAALQWRFRPLSADDKHGAVRVAYRIIATARSVKTVEIPLRFSGT